MRARQCCRNAVAAMPNSPTTPITRWPPGAKVLALALVERSLAEAQRLLGVRPALWLHGGGAQALRDRLPVHEWVPDAVLRGLARWHAHCIA